MSDPIKQLRRELVAAARREAIRHRAGRAPYWWGLSARRRLRWMGVVAVVVAAVSGTALAASGVFGTAVAPGPRLLGGAARGSVVLSPLRVRDPAGGLPWGIRTYTPRYSAKGPAAKSAGVTCAQVGRVFDGKLGVIGEDGAFANDGLFHPVPVQPGRDDCTRAKSFVAFPGLIPASAFIGPGSCTAPNAAANEGRDTGTRAGPTALPSRHDARSAKSTCRSSGLRLVVFGIAPQNAAGIRLTGVVPRVSEYFGSEGRAFLFVLPARSGSRASPTHLRVEILLSRRS